MPEGYRLKARNVAEVSAVFDGFRAAALKVLARRYGRLVAAHAVARADLAALGLAERAAADLVAAACAAVGVRGDGAFPFADLNCAVDVFFVEDAVLARFVHGDESYLAAWEGAPGVVRWDLPPRPRGGAGEARWQARKRYWDLVDGRKGLAGGMRLSLIGDGLPRIGWGGIRRHLPLFEQRVREAAARLCESDPTLSQGQAAEKARSLLEKELTKDSFAAGRAVRAPRAAPPPPRPRPAEEAREPTPAEAIRTAAAAARLARGSSPRVPSDGRAASIDHADVVVSSDGRTFMATPYVGLDMTNRVFVQVGDSHVAVSQGGVQFGYVTGVQRSAIDHLRHCRTVTLVEVERRDGRRLLRAKHAAIVSDISLGESVNVGLGGFRRPGKTADDREITEWDSRE